MSALSGWDACMPQRVIAGKSPGDRADALEKDLACLMDDCEGTSSVPFKPQSLDQFDNCLPG